MTTGTLKITGKTTAGSTLTVAPGTLADTNGVGAISYKWIDSATGAVLSTNPSYILNATDVTKHINVVASYLDSFGTPNSLTSVDILNRPHTGTITINNPVTVGSILSVTNTIKDADGIVGAFSYKWFANGVEIAGKTLSTYKISDLDVGKNITAVLSYTDKLNRVETESKITDVVTVSTKTSSANDVLTSTTSPDKLTGGLGADSFKFVNAVTSGIDAKTRDVITDFNHSQGDKIDLTGLGFTSLGLKPTDPLISAIGKLWFDSDTTVLYGSTDTDIDPEFSIQLTGVTVLEQNDVKLV